MVTLRLLANPKVKARVTEGRAQSMIQSRHWRRDYAMTAQQRKKLVDTVLQSGELNILMGGKKSPTT